MKGKIILHIDMNSYFASVEQQANPFLRGKPVGVCAYLSPRGCIIASSREAKARGIKAGCTVAEARRLDPAVVLVENEPAKYRSTTERIFKILSEYTDALEPYSIDEAFLDLTGWAKDFKQAEAIGHELAARIKSEVGEWLSASAGISWTKFLAKFASDIGPKGGMLVITRKNLDNLLNGRPLTDAWGIGQAMAERLKCLGINNLLELKNSSADKIRRVLGRYGYYLWANVNGLEISAVSQLAVSVGCLTPVSGQMSLLTNNLARKDLNRAMDKLNNKYGEYTVISGAMFGLKEQARDRIGFRKIINI